MSHQRRVGRRVWLREDPKEGFPRERGVIEALETGGVYLVRVDPEYRVEPDDDGSREVTDVQIETRAESRKIERAAQLRKRMAALAEHQAEHIRQQRKHEDAVRKRQETAARALRKEREED